MIGAQILIWAVIAAIGAIDYVLLAVQGMTITIKWVEIVIVVFLYAVSLGIQQRNPPAARLFISVAQICALAYVGAVLSYAAMAASPFPLADAALARADAALGFDWLAWFTWISAHPTLHFILALAYASIPLQLLGLLVFFGYADSRRVDELVLAALLSIALIIPIMVLLPAVGAWSQHGVGVVEPWRGDILALRSHTLLTVGEPDGIISFPSFHTILGVLFANMARGRKWFVPVLLLNLLLVASVLSEGSHYGVDILGGLAVAFIVIAVSRSILTRCSRMDATRATAQPRFAESNHEPRCIIEQVTAASRVEMSDG